MQAPLTGLPLDLIRINAAAAWLADACLNPRLDVTNQPMSSFASVLPGQAARASLDGRPLTYSEGLFLKQLGDRLRATRLRRNLSRRELARRSGISERYIARIEGGTGNVSILLLLRIAQALRGAEGVSMMGGECWESWF